MHTVSYDNSHRQIRAAEARHWSPDPEVERAEADYIRAVRARLTAEHYAENCPDDRLGPALVLVAGATDTQAMALDALHDVATLSPADVRALNDRAISEWLAGRGVRGEA
jgi:Flp pilus assembly protein TadD